MSVSEEELNDQEDTLNKPIYLFGKDIRQVKCLRSSILFGVSSGIGLGLGSFMWTSKVKFSINVALFSVWIGIFLYWIPCRYKYETRLIEMQRIKKALDKHLEEKKKVKENTS